MPRFPHNPAFDDAPQPPYRFLVYVLMLVIAAAFAGFVWNWYAGPTTPQPRPAPAPELVIQEDPTADVEASVEAPGAGVEAAPDGADVTQETAEQSVGQVQLSPGPRFVSNGPYLAQLVALQSQARVEAAWAGIASRAPDLFASARLDVERADLGASGTYYRVRAGYFADRENATRFCERMRRMAQDCIVVAR